MALFDTIRAGSSGATDYEVERSLRFNHHDNAYLTYIPSSDGNRQKWTWSGWVKRVRLGSTTYGLFTSQNGGDGGGNNGIASIYFGSDDKIHTYYDTTSGDNYGAINDAVYRDTSAWYHIVWQVDAANSTSKIFVNGVSQTIASGSQPISGYNYTMNQSGRRMTYGIDAWDLYTPASIYVAECHYSDGQLYDADVFAETDSETGQWVPKASPAISYGTNGHYLNFSDNSNNTAATIGKDYSGQGNNFTPTNISVSAGTSNDSLEDTPTNNFCVISRLDSWRSSTEVEDGSLKFRRHAANFGGARGTFAVKTGKWYFEFTKGSGLVQAGFVNTDFNINYNGGDVGLSSSGAFACGIAYDSRGTWYGYTGSSPSSIANDDIIGVAFDADNFKFYFHKNGTYYGSGNPSTGSNGIAPNHSNSISKQDYMTFAPYFNGENGNGYANFGQRPFVHSIPTGYKSLCSANLPDPGIDIPTEHFNTILYTANGQVRSLTGVGFQPDWVWIKSRIGGQNNALFDSVRGVNNQLRSDTTGGELTGYTNLVTSFDSDGFSLGTDSQVGDVNYNSQPHVAWNWNAGGSTVTNTAGSVNTQVRANATAGFSIITWTGTGSNLTIGHGLGVKPSAHITKARAGGSVGCAWFVYFSVLGANNNLRLNTTAAASSGSGQSDLYNDVEPTSSVITIGNSSCINVSSGTYVTYAFAEVEGYSKFGRYVGNGNSNGTFVFTGFRPAWVMVKNKDSSYSWDINDSTRDPDNVCEKVLSANLNDQEATATSMDFLSNGFKLRVNNNSQNRSGDTFVFFAFAESPFKNSRAR